MTATDARELRRSIRLPQAVALYVSAILGAGVLVLPGQVATLAGPASLLAWGFCCLLGIPLAVMFAQLGRAHPNAGGVSTYVGAAFGKAGGGVVGWWYFVAGSIGQTIVPLTGGYYLTQALHLDQRWAYLAAGLILATAVGANVKGAKTSATIQVALACGVAAILVAAIVAAVPRMDAGRATPLAPHGASSVGQAVLILFFAFAGWEAVAHLAEEFHDSRDLTRATGLTIGIVSVLYLGLATAVVLTGTYGAPAVDRVAIGSLLADGFGDVAALIAGVVAVVISLGTTNAFVAAVSRLGFALAREGWLPRFARRVRSNGTPVGGVALVGAVAAAGLVVSALLGWGTEQLLFVPSVLVMMVYLGAAASGVRLLRGLGRTCAVLTMGMTGLVIPSAAAHVIVPVIVATAALAYRALATRRR